MTTVDTLVLDSGLPIQLIKRNSTLDADGFYVSHNGYDTGIYGCETTALVVGQMQGFYILNGDHREAYSALIAKGFDACLEYFNANVAQANKFSEHARTDLPAWKSGVRC